MCWAVPRRSASPVIAQPQDQRKNPVSATKTSGVYQIGDLTCLKQGPGVTPQPATLHGR